jgi:hypothetical protein
MEVLLRVINSFCRPLVIITIRPQRQPPVMCRTEGARIRADGRQPNGIEVLCIAAKRV